MTQIKLHLLFKITSKVIHSFEPVVSLYPLPKQSLVTVWKRFLSSSHDLKHCGKNHSTGMPNPCERKGCCQTCHLWAARDLPLSFQNCFFTTHIFLISPFANIHMIFDIWAAFIIYIGIYLLVITCYVSFKSYFF